MCFYEGSFIDLSNIQVNTVIFSLGFFNSCSRCLVLLSCCLVSVWYLWHTSPLHDISNWDETVVCTFIGILRSLIYCLQTDCSDVSFVWCLKSDFCNSTLKEEETVICDHVTVAHLALHDLINWYRIINLSSAIPSLCLIIIAWEA